MKRIAVEHLNKGFKLSRRGGESVLGHIVSIFSALSRRGRAAAPAHSRTVSVARDISFDAAEGETIGVIGLNGSGKSSLLRLIAGIYRPDSGSISTEGSLVYLSGFGQGLQPLLTMRENIYLMGALHGLSVADIRSRFDEIVAFSGLAEFVEAKVYQFSSGMLTRLNFSVMILSIGHRKPDILLLDEVFSSGGDIDFQARALAKMKELIHGGATVLLVSHHLETIRKQCDRVIWMEKGEIVRMGAPESVVSEYQLARSVRSAGAK